MQEGEMKIYKIKKGIQFKLVRIPCGRYYVEMSRKGRGFGFRTDIRKFMGIKAFLKDISKKEIK
ncbi:unnamed protein product [marine sediment metagenome]|uniref:Uncharacterized protein n=1 Tax=marine sediment metagenome TaxID=412755 RepID=X0U4Q7_9ZZZZ